MFCFKAHAVCSAVAETRALLNQMIEENRFALAEARDKLERLQTTQEASDGIKDQTPDHEQLDIRGPFATYKQYMASCLNSPCHSFYCLNIIIMKMVSFPSFRSHENKSSLSLLQETVREYEVTQMALDCIKSGESPVMNGK